MLPEIVFIGSGKVAGYLSDAWKNSGVVIRQNFSQSGKKLHEDIPVTSNYASLNTSGALVIVAVKDDAIEEVSKALAGKKMAGVAHTSGTVSTEVFKNISENRGALWPIFSFSGKISQTKFPVLITAESDSIQQQLHDLASIVSSEIRFVSDDQRKWMHLAAVFTNNFSNHLFAVAQDLLKGKNIDPKILLPIFRQTVDKLELNSPEESQTGIARRGDRTAIAKQIEMLASDADARELYEIFTNQILKKYHGK